MFIRTIASYKMPNDSAVHFLDVNLEPLAVDEMIKLAESPYQDENYVRIAYSVGNSAFRLYSDENFAGIIERKASDFQNDHSDKTTLTTTAPTNCLYFDTSYRSPGVCDWSREFKLFKGTQFLGAIGIFTINLTDDSTLSDKLRAITYIAQYSIQSGNPFNRLLIAINKPECWEIAFVQLKILKPPLSRTRSCRVNTTLFNSPSQFIRAIVSGKKVNDIDHDQHKSWFDY